MTQPFLEELKRIQKSNEKYNVRDFLNRAELFNSFLDYFHLEDYTTDFKHAMNEFELEMQQGNHLLPLLLGKNFLKGKPYIQDLAAYGNVEIVGSCGTGKSYLLNQLFLNLVTTNSPKDLDILIADIKESTYTKYMNKFPHVKGYNTTSESILNLLHDVHMKLLERYQLLMEQDFVDIHSYNKHCEKTGEERKLPRIVVIIDELTVILAQLKNENNHGIFTENYNLLNAIAEKGERVGIHVITSGQRVELRTKSKFLTPSTSIKLAFKTTNENDYKLLFNAEEKIIEKPNMVGKYISKGLDGKFIVGETYVTGLDINKQEALLDILAEDWLRRINN